MSALAATLWVLGALAFLGWAARARAAARSADRPAPRAAAVTAALSLAALAVGAVLALALAPVWSGVRDGGEPPRARLVLHGVELALPADADRAASIGWSPEADLRLPTGLTAAERRGGDLLAVRPRGAAGLVIAHAPDEGDAEPGGAAVLLARIGGAGVDREASLAAAADRLARGCGTAAAAPAELTVDGADRALAVLCEAGTPRLALAIGRAGADRARVAPLSRAGGRFRPMQRELAAGALVQIGSNADGAPGVEVWEVPAPPGGTRLLVAPPEEGAGCGAWQRAVSEAELDATADAANANATVAATADTAAPARAYPGGPAADPPRSSCVLPVMGPLSLEVRRQVPDVAGLGLRAGWAAALLILPALVLLLWLAAEPRSRLTRRRLAEALALGAVSALLAGLACVRLLWAHRIDMLRDLDPLGWRTGENLLWIGLVAAALAATAAGRALPQAPPARRLALALAGWAAAVLLTLCATGASLPSGRDLALAALSLALGAGPTLAAARLDPVMALGRPLAALRSGPVLLLVVLAGVALIAPPTPGIKLAVAWAIPLAFLGAARARPAAALFAGAAAALAALRLDPGLAAALVIPGMALALVIAARQVGGEPDAAAPQRRPVPIAAAHAALVLLAAAAIMLIAVSAGAADPGRALTGAALHAPLLLVALLAPAVLAAWRRRGARAALPWAAAAVAALVAWGARGPLLEAVLRSDTQAARRIAQVVDPGYALLRDPAPFAAGLTAWREAALPAGDPWTGQGLFGARLVDAGVLLSVENDYLPVLVLREAGVLGVLAIALLLAGAAALLWLLVGERFRGGGAAERRRLAALLLGGLVIYQPLAALGALPLTGLPWPGLGIDGPSEWFLLTALLLWIALWGAEDADAAEAGVVTAGPARPAAPPATARRLEQVAAALAMAAALLLLARAGLAAATRPATPEGTEAALAYARGLSCDSTDTVTVTDTDTDTDTGTGTGTGTGTDTDTDSDSDSDTDTDTDTDTEIAAALPSRLAGRPSDRATSRFHAELQRAWARARPGVLADLARILDGDQAACRPGEADERCAVRVSLGLPELVVRVDRPAGEPPRIRCSVAPSESHLRLLRLPSARPYQGARVRLVSRAMGAAARDVGELVSGGMVIRLRPDAPPLELPRDPAGLVAAARVELGGGAAITAESGAARIDVPAGDPGTVRLLTRSAAGTWERVPLAGPSAPLEQVSLLVVGGRAARGVWLFRPPSRWPRAPDGPAVVDPLLADDVGARPGASRRAYLYGGLLPEVGWVNRGAHRASLGLDGWVRVALDEHIAGGAAAPGRCGTLDPPPPDLGRVCALAADGAVECRVSIQPELSLRLRHLTELVALDPGAFAPRSGDPKAPPLGGQIALVRGDTGEILAQAEFVPGRASSLYAPATPAIERQLVRAREDRDLDTGERLPPAMRGEASGEKVEWNRPIAAGSAMKPFVARAFERAAPELTRRLWIRGAPREHAACRGGRAHALLGHCPPTDSLWNHPEEWGMPVSSFLSQSANWYMAALGLLGTALPAGRVGLGDREVSGAELLAAGVGEHPTNAALWTAQGNRRVITGTRGVDLEALAATPMWRELERLLGRPLCLDGDKASCRRRAARADLCAARALPIAEPGADLRHLVATGPDRFDLYPQQKASGRGPARRVPTFEYLQFLRGSGVHPLGSLLQLTDGFNRLVFEQAPGPRGYRLAASWFPVPATGSLPSADCAAAPHTGDPVRDGLCEALRSGTASRALGDLLGDPGLALYGAKTGTIDSLADVAERRATCRRFNQAHTLTDRPRRAGSQPYWLPCGGGRTGDDSLLLISFAVPTAEGPVPLTLGLRFRRAGAGFATEVARHYIAAVRDYFAPAARRLP